MAILSFAIRFENVDSLIGNEIFSSWSKYLLSNISRAPKINSSVTFLKTVYK